MYGNKICNSIVLIMDTYVCATRLKDRELLPSHEVFFSRSPQATPLLGSPHVVVESGSRLVDLQCVFHTFGEIS